MTYVKYNSLVHYVMTAAVRFHYVGTGVKNDQENAPHTDCHLVD